MNEIHYLSEEHLLLFLVQLFILLSTAKLLGSLCRRLGYPELAGEILAGILLGATVLGRVAPGVYEAVFPYELIQDNMRETVSWLGVLFLLLATGFEVSVSTVWKQGKAVVTIGVVGVLIPMLIGMATFCWFPSDLWGPNANRLVFTLFLSTAASISALAVIARVLHDLEVLKTDLGLTTLSAFVVNDLLGWMIFTFVLGITTEHAADTGTILRVFFEILLFGTLCLTVGSKVVGAVTERLKRSSLPQPAATLSFIAALAILCGAVTQAIGIHAILGFFLAGIMAGNTPVISERTRDIMSQMVHSVFVPVFFASIGIRIDFVSNFNLLLVLAFTAVAMGGKFLGAWIGAVLAKASRADAFSIGIAFIPGGAMEIVVGMLALELGLIVENVFVAVVFAALLSSTVVGPLLGWSLNLRRTVNIQDYLSGGRIIPDVAARGRWAAIEELCRHVADAHPEIDVDSMTSAVCDREKLMGTGLEKGVAIPHGRLPRLESPLIAFGRSRQGIDWDARDGLATHYIFLVLTPEGEEDIQVQIIAAIARALLRPTVQKELKAAANGDDMLRILRTAIKRSLGDFGGN